MTRTPTCPVSDRAADHVWDLHASLRDGLPCGCGRFALRSDTDGRLYMVAVDEARVRSSALDLPAALRG
jgi:hypothetical protein